MKLGEPWICTQCLLISSTSTHPHQPLPQLPLVSYTCTAGKVIVDAGAASEQHRYWPTGQHTYVSWLRAADSQNGGFHSVRSTNLHHIPPFSFQFKRTIMFLINALKTSHLLSSLARTVQRFKKIKGKRPNEQMLSNKICSIRKLE